MLKKVRRFFRLLWASIKYIFRYLFERERLLRNKFKISVTIFHLIIFIVLFFVYANNRDDKISTQTVADTKKENSNIATNIEQNATENNLTDFHISIPKINIKAPITANVDATNKTTYNKALESGVVQMKGSAFPGEKSNIFIFGHSSFYESEAGNYKDIFATLNQLKIDDQIFIQYNKKEFIYIVSSIEIVEPSNVAIADPTLEEQLTLMTCWPLNTTDKRYVVIAKPQG